MKPRIRTLLLVLATLALGGCGSGSPDTPATASAGADPDRQPQAAQASAGAAADCRPRATDPSAGPDIAGLQLGMSRDDAVNQVRCRLPEAQVQMEASFLSDMRATSVTLGDQAFVAQSGDSEPCDYRRGGWMNCGMGNQKWSFVEEWIKVATPGMPGHESAFAIWRTQRFREGQMPSIKAVMTALREKYGDFHERPDPPQYYRTKLMWARDTEGESIAEVNPIFEQCVGGVNAEGVSWQTWREGCGLTIKAEIEINSQNPDLATALHVVLMDQQKLFLLGDAMQEAITGLERQRRDAEARKGDASKVDL